MSVASIDYHSACLCLSLDLFLNNNKKKELDQLIQTKYLEDLIKMYKIEYRLSEKERILTDEMFIKDISEKEIQALSLSNLDLCGHIWEF